MNKRKRRRVRQRKLIRNVYRLEIGPNVSMVLVLLMIASIIITAVQLK